MNRQERLKDWYVRYHLIFGKRYTRKQKDRFLKSLSTDILQYRKDLKLDTFKLNKKSKQEYRNLYVGNVEKADTVVCSYYDTPACRFSPYNFFDVEHRMKSTTMFILISSILYILFGLVFTLIVAMPLFQTKPIFSFPSILCIVFYIIYFYLLNKITRGWPRRKNLVQNTSSVLLLLECIAHRKSKRVAYAFLDAGCTNNAGLDRLMEKTKGKILMLDSIGSDQPLYLVNPELQRSNSLNTFDKIESLYSSNERLVYLISGEKEKDRFVLSRRALLAKQLNEQNMNRVLAFLNQLLK